MKTQNANSCAQSALEQHIAHRKSYERSREGLRTSARLLGEEIRSMRKKKNLTMRGTAKLLGISAPFLADIEYGNRNVSEELGNKIHELLYQ